MRVSPNSQHCMRSCALASSSVPCRWATSKDATTRNAGPRKQTLADVFCFEEVTGAGARLGRQSLPTQAPQWSAGAKAHLFLRLQRSEDGRRRHAKRAESSLLAVARFCRGRCMLLPARELWQASKLFRGAGARRCSPLLMLTVTGPAGWSQLQSCSSLQPHSSRPKEQEHGTPLLGEGEANLTLVL